MRRVLIGCCISTVVILIILSGYGWVANAQGTGVIRGKVTGDGNVALANVIVRAYVKEDFMGIIQWTYAGQVTTNGTGNYTISNLNAGTYHISFNEVFPVPGYFAEFYNNAADQVSATDIPLAAGATVSNINAKLSSGAHIQGKVTDLQGKALSNIRVFALDNNNSFQSAFETDVNGNYEIRNLMAGGYRIAFEDTRQPPIYRRGYFNNALEQENATVITVATDQLVNNINMQLNRLSFITGKVTDAQNRPLVNIQLTAQQSSMEEIGGVISEVWRDRASAQTDTAGNYILSGLLEGAYRVRFSDPGGWKYSKEYYNNVVDPRAASLLTVTLNTTTTNINAQLALRGAITGKITNRQGEPLDQVEVTAEVRDISLPVNRWEVARITRSNANGEYTLCCLDADSYRLRFLDTQNRYMAEYYNNLYYDYNSSLDDVTMVTVTAEITTTGIDAQLSRPSTLISRVTNQQNQPISDLSVTLYGYSPVGGGAWYNTYIYSERIQDAYVMGVRPGRYRIQFEDGRDPDRYVGEFYNNAPDINTATDITVTEEATVTVTAVLADKARIDGRVTELNGAAIPNIRVNAWRLFPSQQQSSWQEVANTNTDQNGYYSLSGLTPDTYRIGFAVMYPPETFAGEFYNNVAMIDDATDIVVHEGEATLQIDAQLGRPGRLSGRVTNTNGESLANIAVSFYLYRQSDPSNSHWYPAGSTQTDFNGVYTSPGLGSGLYRVGFQDYSNSYHTGFYNNVGYLENAATITVTPEVTVTGINMQLPTNPFLWPPFAQDDEIVVEEGATTNLLATSVSSVLANDRAEAGPLQATVVAMPKHGVLNVNPDGSFSYTHNGDEATSDFFTYSVNDSARQSNIAKVTITIQPVNDPPVAGNDSATVSRGQSVTVLDSGAKSLLANDSDPDSSVLTATLKTVPAHGTVTITANGAFTYTHDGSAGTSDSFAYQATDNLGASAVATVTVAINPFTFSKTVGMAGIKPLCTPVDEIHAPVGTTIVYCYTLRNTGDAPLTTHSLVDSHLGSLLTNHVHTVAPGAVFSVTFTQTLTISTTNIATWTVTSAAEQAVAAPSTNIARTAATVRIAGPTDDSDGDTIPDNQEKAGDSDGDNIPNFLDTDADGDGKFDKDEVGSNPAQPADSDQDGIPDYLDSQSAPLQRQLFLPVIQR
jgi:VCBS repeat-containing protein